MSHEEQRSRMAVLLFTDIVDSVAIERRLGTDSYSRLLKLHHQLFMRAVELVGGGKIRSDTGDGILSEFITATDAVNAALLFQMLLRDTKWERESPKVRIGIHLGQLSEIQFDPASPGKIVGMPVNIANRVLGLARGGQILITRPVYDDARQFVREHPIYQADRPPPAIRWKRHGHYDLQGVDDPIEVFEVGARGFAPLTPPRDSEKAKATTPSGETTALNKWRPAAGAVMAVLCGLALWQMPLGQRWVNASYDYLFRFGSRTVTNEVVLILMDNGAYEELNQERDKPWDRALHAKLLNRLADDGCPLVVLDVLFRSPREPVSDQALAGAMQRLKNVVLMAEHARSSHPDFDDVGPVLPAEFFLSAADTKWGVAWLDPDLDLIVRRHWPFPAPGPHPSLPWTAARLAGANLDAQPSNRWLRYYGTEGTWTAISYRIALARTTNYFRDKIVFIGNKPKTTLPGDETDEFRTPYTRWTGECVGGVEILATEFLNLVNDEWLRRPAWWVELLVLLMTGVSLGSGLCFIRPMLACFVATGAAIAFTFGAVMLSQLSNCWFPWLVIVGGQVPFALFFCLATKQIRREAKAPEKAFGPSDTVVVTNLLDAADYELFDPPFGEGGFGKVWLVRNAIGQWQALKAVYAAKFGKELGPYEAEFQGIKKYKPVSDKHPGLLQIDFVSMLKPEGYFYYVMELGDALAPGWEKKPKLYKPRDLDTLRKQAYGRRLRVADCVRIVIALADALDFLHRQGLTHRDIKPSNVIFVKGQPKLADVGLVADIRPADQIKTLVGTPGYMPPPPELAGTPQADIYALGMLLYVISTGREPDSFPNLSTTLMEQSGHAEFIRLNAVIVKACQPDPAQRYASAAEMHRALLET